MLKGRFMLILQKCIRCRIHDAYFNLALQYVVYFESSFRWYKYVLSGNTALLKTC